MAIAGHHMSSYLEIINRVRHGQNSVSNWYYHVFTKHISCHITAIMYFWGVKPDYVTYSMFVFGLVGCGFYSIGTNTSYFIGSLFFLLLNIADTSDGELARLIDKTSDFGEYLDRLCHYFTNSLMCLSLGLGLYINSGEVFFLFLGSMSCAFYVLDDASKDLLFLIDSKINLPRSAAAQTVSLSKNSKVKWILLHLFAHSSVWHVLTIIAGVSIFVPTLNSFMEKIYVLYIALFLVTIPIKTLFRFNYIIRKYRS